MVKSEPFENNRSRAILYSNLDTELAGASVDDAIAVVTQVLSDLNELKKFGIDRCR